MIALGYNKYGISALPFQLLSGSDITTLQSSKAGTLDISLLALLP